MRLEDARGHVGDTLLHQFLDQPVQEAELVEVGNHALHVRFAGTSEVVTMHPRTFTLKPGQPGRCALEVRIDGDDSTRSLLADLPEDGSELFVMVRARRGRIEIRKCSPGWWGADEHLSGG
jgi:hypothetical protein